MRFECFIQGSFVPKISPLGQKLWPTGRGQTDTHTHTHTHRQTDRQRKQTLRTPLFEFIFLIFDFIFKERSDYNVQDGGTKSKEVIQILLH